MPFERNTMVNVYKDIGLNHRLEDVKERVQRQYEDGSHERYT